jgi:hypothetical protein
LKNSSASTVSCVIGKWARIFADHFGHSLSAEELAAIQLALDDLRPCDLEQACALALKECEFYPRVCDIRSRAARIAEKRRRASEDRSEQERREREQTQAASDTDRDEAKADFYRRLEGILGVRPGTLTDDNSRAVVMERWGRDNERRRRQQIAARDRSVSE